MESLEQKHFFERRLFNIESSGVRIRIKSVQDDLERLVPFEEISSKTFNIKSNELLNLFLGIIFFVFTIGFIPGFELSWKFFFIFSLSLTFTLVFLGAYYKDSVGYKCIQCDNSLIELFYKNKYKEVVDSFIKTIIEQRNNYLKKKYLMIDEALTYELFMTRLRWMMEENIIDTSEYEMLKQRYSGNNHELH